LPGIEVHYQCPESGRLVVIQEAADDEAEMAGLQRIKALAGVAAAEMVYHYVHNDVDKDSDKASAHNNSQGDQGGELSWA
jgi:nitrate reductase NapAB chaperone NapD